MAEDTSSNLIENLAEQYARKYHEGQFRKKSMLSYVAHPRNVVRYLKLLGINDQDVLAIAWLHDTMEDTNLSYDSICDIFGKKVADGVYILTRNVGEEEYKQRLNESPVDIQRVKICDLADNVRTLECLSQKGIEKKIEDAKTFYIPLAQGLCTKLAKIIERRIKAYYILDGYHKA